MIEWRAHPVSQRFLKELKNGIADATDSLIHRTEDHRFLQGFILAMKEVLELAESNE